MGQQIIRCPGKQVGYFLGRCMSCNHASFFTFLGSNSYKRGCRLLGFPPLVPWVAAQGLVSAGSKWGKPLSNDGPWHGNSRAYLTSWWDGHFLCKSDQEITNLNIMVEFPSSQSTLDLGEQKTRQEEEFLERIMHSHLFNRNLLGAYKMWLLRLQRRIIINSQLLL